jgi:hypothetical protein
VWELHPQLDVLNHLFFKYLQCYSHVFELFAHDLLQQRAQFRKGSVILVIVPALDENTVLRLPLEVLSHVIYYNTLLDVPFSIFRIRLLPPKSR